MAAFTIFDIVNVPFGYMRVDASLPHFGQQRKAPSCGFKLEETYAGFGFSCCLCEVPRRLAAIREHANAQRFPRIGESIEVTASVGRSDRSIQPHPKLVAMLDATPAAKEVFDGLAPSRQTEIVRYIDGLKNDDSVDRNVTRARYFLLRKTRFVGRKAP